jgi:signal transduction histidine kinase/DNA-binding response OmpR family regulator
MNQCLRSVWQTQKNSLSVMYLGGLFVISWVFFFWNSAAESPLLSPVCTLALFVLWRKGPGALRLSHFAFIQWAAATSAGYSQHQALVWSFSHCVLVAIAYTGIQHSKFLAEQRQDLASLRRVAVLFFASSCLSAGIFAGLLASSSAQAFNLALDYIRSQANGFFYCAIACMVYGSATAKQAAKSALLITAATVITTGILLAIVALTPFPFIYGLLPFCLMALRIPTLALAIIGYGSQGIIYYCYFFSSLQLPSLAAFTEGQFIQAAALMFFIPQLMSLMLREFELRQQQVQVLTERLTLANKVVGLGVWEWHVRDHNLWWDTTMYQLYGINSQVNAASYSLWRSCLHPDDVPQIERLLKNIARGKAEFSASFRIINPKTGVRYMQASATIIYDEQKKPLRYVGMNWDVTHLKDAEIALQTAKQKAEVASRTKSEFVANMSHEIRTPLNATLGTVQLLHNTPLSLQQHKYLEMIKTSGESLLAILNDILDFSKIEAGHMEVAPSIFNLNDIMARLATIMSVNAGEKDLELIINVDANVPRLLEGDALRLQQVLVNLTSNAIRFTPEGEVLLHVQLQAQEDDQIALHFLVKDTGIGIAKHKQLNLFEAFTQADSSTTRQYGGTGLGLAIAKRLIQLLGGELSLRSEEGEGAEFYFCIPLRLAAQTQTSHPLETKPLRIFVVDDNPQTLQALSTIMHLWSWDLVTANNLAKAFHTFNKAQKEKPFDAILLDWRLCDYHGQSLFSALAAQGLSADTARIIMDTSHSRALRVQPHLDAFCDGHLVKPVTPAALLDTINEALAARRGTTPPEQAQLGFPAFLGLDGKRFLVVEDNLLNQTVAKGLLEQFGAKVTLAQHGLDALNQWRENKSGWDCILLDIQMPIMDGYSCCEALHQEGNSIPIIAMSAGVLASERQRCIDLGMQGFVAKPISINDMLQVISSVLHQRAPTLVEKPQRHDNTLIYPERLLQHLEANSPQAAAIVENIAPLIAETRQQLTQIAQHLDAQNLLALKQLFHRQKGAWGNLGAQPLHRQICSIETLLQQKRFTRHCRQWSAYQQVLSHTLQAAEAWLADKAADYRTRPQLASAHSYSELLNLLREQNLKACDIYEALKPHLRQHLPEQPMQALDVAMRQLHFVDAQRFLEEYVL